MRKDEVVGFDRGVRTDADELSIGRSGANETAKGRGCFRQARIGSTRSNVARSHRSVQRLANQAIRGRRESVQMIVAVGQGHAAGDDSAAGCVFDKYVTTEN